MDPDPENDAVHATPDSQQRKIYTFIPWYLYSEGWKGVLLVPLGKVDVLKGRIQEVFVDVGAGSGGGGRRTGGGALLLLWAALVAGSTSYYRCHK